jgi:hypothetical protein
MESTMDWGAEIPLVLIGAAFGTIFTILFDTLRRWTASRGGELTGPWIQKIPPGYHKNYERRDELKIRHRPRSGRITFEIVRSEPADESGRRWKGEGFVRGNELVATFRPTGAGHDGSSYGVLVLHRDPESAGSRWSGAYLRPGTDIQRNVTAPNLAPVELTWQRQ